MIIEIKNTIEYLEGLRTQIRSDIVNAMDNNKDVKVLCSQLGDVSAKIMLLNCPVRSIQVLEDMAA